MNIITRIKLYFLMKRYQKEIIKRMDDKIKNMFSNTVGFEAIIKTKRK